jgi:hypothetical protein
MNWFKSFWRKPNAPQSNPPGDSVEPRSSFSATEEVMGNFTPRAQQVLALSRREADRFHHNFVGTEHLLLGLIKLGQGTAVNVIRKMGLDLEIVRQEVEKQVGTGPDQRMIGNRPYTPRVKKVLALAAKEARALNHTYVGTEHVLLGLLREGDGVAARVLKNLDVDLEQTRLEILKELDPNFTPAKAESAASMSDTAPPSTTATTPVSGKPAGAKSGLSPDDTVDTSKRYDICCTNGSQEVVVYRNARFKGIKHLFEVYEYDSQSGYVEIEQADGQTVFVARSSIIRFQESGTTPPAAADPGKQP